MPLPCGQGEQQQVVARLERKETLDVSIHGAGPVGVGNSSHNSSQTTISQVTANKCGVRCAVCGVRCAVCGVRCAVCGVPKAFHRVQALSSTTRLGTLHEPAQEPDHCIDVSLEMRNPIQFH